ncbi:TfoX/Sxy family protein [Sulfitobacter aestuariivivens]|uniref:TfoX/Sxy family protein n=1 Tax=Sulfitobacter aestuariivivens TaxID=2766981 RepID=A0A927D436_9RHOB|nr:TfoX/Sxy family protein [Sulfitobacter aestuariivivens]
MSLSEADIAFARELFADMPDLSTRKMFGGLGIYSQGTIFALLMSDSRFMIKAQDGPFADRLASMGCEKWTYTRKDGAASSMPYWNMPDAALDDPAEACALAQDALAALR